MKSEVWKSLNNTECGPYDEANGEAKICRLALQRIMRCPGFQSLHEFQSHSFSKFLEWTDMDSASIHEARSTEVVARMR